MTDKKLKVITLRVSKELLDRMSEVRTTEGISVTFQFVEGAKMFLLKRKEKK